jgi:hypothetical protein
MPTKITIELILDDEGLYESGTNEKLETDLVDFQNLAKTFPYVKECSVICIVREVGEERRK